MSYKDRPMTFKITVEVVINSSDGTRQDALDHLGQMIAWHGLDGIQLAALAPLTAKVHGGDVFDVPAKSYGESVTGQTRLR